ncbi:methyl-accepting chemotaxis protein [Burkholderia alba]|uniref:methyl-accepting chemotaxis protein n=1 Tax=Burkholderia alba TaxID=2683677 RepID=UPI002B06048D|nr:methyl-accepting chemotaxis protein [Burkholderia alba]
MMLKPLSVRARLTASFALLIAILAAIAIAAAGALTAANQRFADYVDGVAARAALAQNIRNAVDERAIAARNLVLVTKPADLALEKAAVTRAHADVQRYLQQLNAKLAQAGDLGDDARGLAAEITRVETAYGPVALAIVDLALAGQREAAIAKMNDDCRPLLAALVKATNDYSTYTQRRGEQIVQAAAETLALQRIALLIGCALALCLAMLAGWLLTRSLLRELGAEPAALSAATRRVAAGDLSPITDADAAPAGSVLASMGAMQHSLVDLIGQVRVAASHIRTGSEEIAAGNLDLSSRTEEQASSLQQTTASMEELTSTVRQNADHAHLASQLATQASDVARRGHTVVDQVLASMGDISDSSNRIAEITGLIEGIAFQTNILALNAAVEAARAGEEGRGFAVVAGEVRSLAQRSSNAAKEIKDLIATSVDRIRNGATLAGEAGRTMTDVTQAVARVTDIMGEIAAASDQQRLGIEQVNQALAQMDTVTQQNAALVEQATAASKSLETQGRQLGEAVASFSLADATGEPATVDTRTIAPRATPGAAPAWEVF